MRPAQINNNYTKQLENTTQMVRRLGKNIHTKANRFGYGLQIPSAPTSPTKILRRVPG